MGCGFLHNPFYKLLVFRGIVVIVASAAMAVENAVYVGIEHLRIFVGKPGRRGRAGCTENDLHSCLFRLFQEPVEEFIGEFPLPGFDLAPGELGNTDYLDSACQHTLQILFPHFLRPVLRIIAGSQCYFVQFYTSFHFSNPPLIRNPLFLLLFQFSYGISLYQLYRGA